ncbi:MAG: HD-GYP domain-containing protein [Anaeromyxobacter sp.]|nr:HD-GYP domain-containing protein [Anaeromyxobacter sp.]MBL0277318.1 HD-GYP domain-containing protein [Anaeromyxobacter sp.]
MKLFRTLLLATVAAGVVPLALLVLLLRVGGVEPPFAMLGAAVAASVASSLAVAALVARRVTSPLGELVHGALDIARGRFGREVKVAVRDELGDLAYTFNHMSRELASYDGENRRLIAALERGYLDTIRALASAIDAKDPYTRGHSERVAALSVEIAREFAFDEASLVAVRYAGLLHDIGKIGVPEQVLRKPARLTPEELTLVRSHAVVGAEIVEGIDFLKAAEPGIRHHHERWDGAGYPDGLRGEAIPLVARIVNAADTWDACTSERPYQRAYSAPEVVAILATLRGAQVDPAVHDAISRVLARRGTMTGAPTT